MYQRAPSDDRNLNSKRAYIDPRSYLRQFMEGIGLYSRAIPALGLGYALTWVYPSLAIIFLLFLILVFILGMFTKTYQKLPLRLPNTLKQTDYNTPESTNRYKYSKASGTINLGNELNTRFELWAIPDDVLVHKLVIGSTGAGKTEALLSLAASVSYVLGGALVYIDAKAAPNVLTALFALARYFGREDCVRFMSYRTGNSEVPQRDWKKLTNTCGVFSQGTASVVQQILEDMMPPSGGENQYFRDRAVAALTVLLPSLVELRGRRLLNLSPSILAQSFKLDKFMQIGFPEHYDHKITFLRETTGEEIVIQNVVSKKRLRAMQDFLMRLPSFKNEEAAIKNPSSQSADVHKQFGFAEGYLGKPLAELGSSQAHMFEVELGEIDFRDTIINNRILGVLVPATEQGKEKKEMQGKIALSGIRIAMSIGLGDESEGTVEDVLRSLPIDKKTPSQVIVDEYPEIAIEGFATSATQGRGLGVGMVFSCQDLGGMIKASKEETQMIFGSTREKWLMSVEDVEETWEWFKKLASTMKVAESKGWEEGKGVSEYQKSFAADIKEIDRINYLDIKEQLLGEAHIFKSAKIVRSKLFYANMDYERVISDFRFNRLLQIRSPNADQITSLSKCLNIEKALEFAIERKEYPKQFQPAIIDDDRVELLGEHWIHKYIATHQLQSNNSFQESFDIVDNESPASSPSQMKHVEEPVAGVIDPKKPKIKKWVYGFKSDDGGLPPSASVVNALAQMASSMGVKPDVAESLSTIAATKIESTVKYTQVDIGPDANDEDMLWDAINDFDDD